MSDACRQAVAVWELLSAIVTAVNRLRDVAVNGAAVNQ